MCTTMDMARSILERAGVDQWELFHQIARSFRVEVKQGAVDSLRKATLSGLGVRVIRDQRLGFSFTAALDLDSIEKTIATAMAVADATPPDPDLDFAPTAAMPPGGEAILARSLLGFPETEKTKIAAEVERLSRAADLRITTIRSAGYADTVVECSLATSLGLEAHGSAGFVNGWVHLMAEADGDQETGYWSEQARSPQGISAEAIARTAARRAVDNLGGRKLASARMPVIIENTVGVDLLSVLCHSFLGESHFKKTASPRVRVGAEIFSRAISIFDDGLDPRGDHAFPFDGEGTPCGRTQVVEKGVVTSLLFDRRYARKLGTGSTGNCRRSGFEGVPVSAVTNIAIEPGSVPLTGLMAEVENGFLVTELMGLHTADPISGDFSVGAAGFRIHKGALDHPVKGVAIAGNILDMFGRIALVADDFRFFGAIGAPSLLVEELVVSGR